MSGSVLKAGDLQQSILQAKQEAKALFGEVEDIHLRIRDTTLVKAASSIRPLNAGSISLKLYHTLRGHQNKVAQVRWSSNSSQVLSASQDGYLILWDIVTGFKKKAIFLENQWVLTCAIAPNCENVVSGGLDNTLTVYNVSSKQPGLSEYEQFYSSVSAVFKGHRAYISDCDFTSNHHLVTSSGDMTCAMWDMAKGSKVRDFVEHLGDVLCLSKFNHISSQSDRPLFVSGSADGYAKVWDPRCQYSVQSFSISNSDVNCIKTFPENHSFVTGSDDGIIRLFDMRSDCELSSYSLASTLTSHDNQGFRSNGNISPTSVDRSSKAESIDSNYNIPGIVSLDLSKSGRLIYGCYADYGCIIWDTLKGQVVGKLGFAGHSNKVNQVRVSPDGIALCTASWDQTIKVWAA
ncbi:Piso0_004656 [Millerozyma farinosa CBS 7064]|uniref:Piso0_004656 protein n=1 Tax=Pichia sorbitophila (strain ATCC MYA-4447 / BCRC 22081 / CBS 7064 / NBRC 10061 / NRRL Y-12695) TaxID=559304 RepID=G8Y9E0_PICSO|nr:Piso0_004656 [Millerozyma farinosa CBS 7064]CCE85085.1 Piso0_004656 [Millerozyma farinosa CBS 7064]